MRRKIFHCTTVHSMHIRTPEHVLLPLASEKWYSRALLSQDGRTFSIEPFCHHTPRETETREQLHRRNRCCCSAIEAYFAKDTHSFGCFSFFLLSFVTSTTAHFLLRSTRTRSLALSSFLAPYLFSFPPTPLRKPFLAFLSASPLLAARFRRTRAPNPTASRRCCRSCFALLLRFRAGAVSRAALPLGGLPTHRTGRRR